MPGTMRFAVCLVGALAGMVLGSSAHEPHAPTTLADPTTRGNSHSVVEASSPSPAWEGEPDQVGQRTQETEQRPNDPDGWSRLGDALMQRAREIPGQAESLYARAETAYRRALKLEEQHVAALVGLAWVANSRHDFDAGERWARKALSLEPRQPEAHALLGDAAVERGDYDAAFEHYQTCLDQRPDLSAYARSAHLLWLTGDARRAKALMYRAIQAGGPRAENAAWCRAQLGLMMFQQGALVPAEKQIEQAHAEAPRNPHVLAALGRIKTARKDYAEAIRLYGQAAELGLGHAALAALTDLWALTGQPDKAEHMFQRVRQLHAEHQHLESQPHAAAADNDHAHGSVELARFLADHDRDLAFALREAETARRSSRSITVLDTLAWCYYKNGRLQEAKEIIAQALRWRTPDAAILFHAGMIHAALGEREVAKRRLYEALNLNPHFHPILAAQAVEKLKSLAVARGGP